MAPSGNRRFLVLGRVGDNSLHDTWIADRETERLWDLRLNCYGKDESRIQNGDFPPVIDRGTKWDSICRQLRAQPELLDTYDYIMLPDDDLLMDVAGINRMFELMIEHDLVIAQPALSYESFISYPILLQCPYFRLRYTNYLESMACCIRSSFLRQLLPMFEEHCTGWGTDLVWTMLMENPSYKAAVVDEVVMTHTRPLFAGSLYQTFAAWKLNPHDEIAKLQQSFENAPDAMLVYGGVARDGRVVGEREARLRSAVQLLTSASRSKKRFNTARLGLASLVRVVTRAGYRPEQLRPVKGTKAEAWFGRTTA